MSAAYPTPTTFAQAIDTLQSDQAGRWTTELHINPHNGAIMLRWTKRGSRWHITTYRGTLQQKLDRVGASALRWIDARASSTGDEREHAVPEP